MKSGILTLLILGHFSVFEVYSCQPPFQAGVTQQQIPALFASSSDGLVSGVASHHSSVPANQGPIATSIDKELSSMQSIDESRSIEYTPYPGYIPPSGTVQRTQSQFPTLIQSAEAIGPRVPINDASLQQLNQELSVNSPYPPTCTPFMRTFADVLSCLEFLPPFEQNEKAGVCTFEEGNSCRFKSSSPAYQVARFPSDELTASFARLAQRPLEDRPIGSFLAMIQRNSLPSADEIILSTPITCQQGNGNLTFQFWSYGNPNLRIQVCTQDYNIRSCTKPILYHESSMITVQVVHPNSSLFDIELTLSNIVGPTIFILDNLSYAAQFCEVSEDNRGEERGQADKEISLLPTEDVVDSFFEEESPAVDENTGEAEFSTRFTDSDSAHAIARPPEAIIGSEAQLSSDNRNFEGPPSVSPFDSTIKPLTIKKIDVCQLVNCTFDGSFCGYKNYKNETIKPSEWNLGTDRVGNPHTGIKNNENSNGGFLYVGTDTNDNSITTYILESPQLNLQEDFLLSLDIYRRSNDITLQVCLNSPFYCPYTVPPFEKGLYWKTGETFSIQKTTKKFYLKAIQWRKFKWLAIDNIRISGPMLC